MNDVLWCGDPACWSWLQILEYKYLYFHFGLAEAQSIKISSKYQNPFFNSKYQNIGCIDADFCADFAIFLHFSRSTRIYWRKCVKMSKNAKILRTKFRKFSENQQKTVIFWYFGCILYFGTLLDFCIFTLKFAKICSQIFIPTPFCRGIDVFLFVCRRGRFGLRFKAAELFKLFNGALQRTKSCSSEWISLGLF